MRVAVDGRSLGGAARGVREYLAGMLAAVGPELELRVVLPRGARLPAGLGEYVVAVRHPAPSRLLHGAGAVARRPRLERLAGGADVVWLPAPAPVAVGYGTPLALTIHDVSFLERPGDFTDEVREIIGSIDGAMGSRRELITRLINLARGEHGRNGGLLFGGASADAGDASMSRFTSRAAAAEATRLSINYDWESYDDAQRARGELTTLLEEIGEDADDATYGAMQDLIAQVVAGLPPEDSNLPRLDNVTLLRTQTALELSYALYDSTAREPEIISRNGIQNPAFLPTLEELEVLVDVT